MSRRTVWMGLSLWVIAGAVVLAQVGPSSAQIQAAIRQFAANATFGSITVTGACNGCSGTDFIIQDEGTARPPRDILNFVGNIVSATDNAGQLRTDITFSAPGADTQVLFNDGGSFGGDAKLTWLKSSSPPLFAILNARVSYTASDLPNTIGDLLSIDAQSSTGLFYAISGISEYNGSGVPSGSNSTVGAGLYGIFYNNSTGVVPKAAAVFADNGATTSAATLTENNGVLISNMSGMGVTNYGLHIADQGSGANDYAIKVDGGKSNFGGSITATDFIVGSTSIAPLRGVTGSVSGGLTLGTCDTGTASVTGATTSMVAVASPTTNPGTAVVWHAYVSAPGVVTVAECGLAIVTPTATTYQVAVLR